MPASREDLYGWEFDFLVVDQEEYVALFVSNGSGDIPPTALDFPFTGPVPTLAELPTPENELLAVLPATGTALLKKTAVGLCKTWPALGERGVYVYDWREHHDAYERIVTPTCPIHCPQLPPALHTAVALRLPFTFAQAPACSHLLIAPAVTASLPSPQTASFLNRISNLFS